MPMKCLHLPFFSSNVIDQDLFFILSAITNINFVRDGISLINF